MNSRNARLLFCACVIATLLIGLLACRSANRSRKGFTQAEVDEVLAALKNTPEAKYRVVLPQFDASGAIVGSKTYGSLPITEVQRLASKKNITFTDVGNVQAIVLDDGGGAGSHTESQSPGQDVGRRIEKILSNIDKSQYTFIR